MAGQNGTGSSGLDKTPQRTAITRLADHANKIAGPPQSFRLERDYAREWMIEQIERRSAIQFLLSHDKEISDGPYSRTVITESLVLPKKAPPALRDDVLDRALEEFDRASQNYAATYPRPQRFFIGAYSRTPERDEDGNIVADVKPVKEFPFLVSPLPEVASAFLQRGSTLDEVNFPAIIGKLQQHSDRDRELLASNMQQMFERYNEREDRLMKHLIDMQERWITSTKERESALNEASLREITVYEKKQEADVRAFIIQAISTYGVGLVKSLADNRDSKVAAGLRSLDKEEICGLMLTTANLSDEKRKKFVPLFTSTLSELPAEKLFDIIDWADQNMPESTKSFILPIFDGAVNSLPPPQLSRMLELVQAKAQQQESQKTDGKKTEKTT